ncbi:MAG: response regulator [Gammaproteobacteria bacterium]
MPPANPAAAAVRFTLLLQRARRRRHRPPRISLNNRHILIVDDNQTNRECCASSCVTGGPTSVKPTAQGRRWRPRIRQLGSAPRAEGKPFDLAILDRVLPGTDGAELGRALKADPRFSAMPLVMMTSVTHQGDANLFARIGFAAYFPKPVTPDDLIRALQVVLDDGAALAAPDPW